VIVGIDGKEVDDIQALRFRIATLAVGEEASLTVLREGKEELLSLQLTPPPEIPPRETTTLRGRTPLAGATVANMSPALAEEMQLDSLQQGVVITQVSGNSGAARVGLQPGDFIVQINGAKITNVADLKAELEKGAQRWQVAIRRAGRVMTVTIEG